MSRRRTGVRAKLRGRGALAGVIAALAVGVPAPMAVAQRSSVDCDRDQFSVYAIDGAVIASSGRAGSRSFELERGEEVRDKGSSGCVAMVSTNRRLALISALTGSWTSLPYQLHEYPSVHLLVGDLVGLAFSSRRAIGFDPDGVRVSVLPLGGDEAVTHWAAGDRIAALATNRRLIGFSQGLGGFVEQNLRLNEPIEAVTSASDVVTVITDSRILTLRAGSGLWGERKRPLNPP